MGRKKPQRPKPDPGRGGNGRGGRGREQGRGNAQQGTVSQRTKNPTTPEEAKGAIASDLKNVIVSYLQNDLLPETALSRQNFRLVLGVSDTDSLADFLKSQEENYQDRTPASETQIENKSDHGEALKPKAKKVTKLQKYPENNN